MPAPGNMNTTIDKLIHMAGEATEIAEVMIKKQ